jgi:peptidoglycan hydrolase-like protein with peptidoglycan-binding domain
MRRSRRLRIMIFLVIGAIAVRLAPATPAYASPMCTTMTVRLHAMMPAASGSINCHLQRGNKNLAVKYLQIALHYCYGREIAPDGDFGPKTEEALIYAQAVERIKRDGVYGPETATHIWFLSDRLDGSCATLNILAHLND